MAAKRLLLIHGRSIKPARDEMSKLAREALAEGLRRAGAAPAAAKLQNGAVKFQLAYYGDVNNRIQAAARPNDRRALRAVDPWNGKPCLPIESLRAAFVRTKAIPKFTAARYRELLRTADDYRFLDEAADFISLLGALVSFGIINTFLIRRAMPDLGQYLVSHETGSAVRERLQALLKPALQAGDDICLIAHSMGAIVSYDVLWKFSHMSEYEALRRRNPRVKLFLTIGCPLGEPGVRRNLLDGRYPESEQYPRILDQWWNYHAEDDYIARAEHMRAAFARMRTRNYLNDIRDRHIYNCWSYEDIGSGRIVSNPHDLYGYLMHEAVGERIAAWMNA